MNIADYGQIAKGIREGAEGYDTFRQNALTRKAGELALIGEKQRQQLALTADKREIEEHEQTLKVNQFQIDKAQQEADFLNQDYFIDDLSKDKPYAPPIPQIESSENPMPKQWNLDKGRGSMFEQVMGNQIYNKNGRKAIKVRDLYNFQKLLDTDINMNLKFTTLKEADLLTQASNIGSKIAEIEQDSMEKNGIVDSVDPKAPNFNKKLAQLKQIQAGIQQQADMTGLMKAALTGELAKKEAGATPQIQTWYEVDPRGNIKNSYTLDANKNEDINIIKLKGLVPANDPRIREDIRKEIAGIYEGERRERFDTQRRMEIVNKFNADPTVKKVEQMDNFSQLIIDVAGSENPIGHASLETLMARASGEVGNLSEADKKPFGGSRALNAKMKQYFSELYSGKKTPENLKFISDLAQTFQETGKRKKISLAKDRAKQYSRALKGKMTEQEIFETLAPAEEMPADLRQSEQKTSSGNRFTIEEIK